MLCSLPTRLLAVASVLFLLMLPLEHAHAGGNDYSEVGTEALGRGGAFAARPSPMSLHFNPAALASVGGIQIELQSHLAISNLCFQGADGDMDPTNDPAEVCNSAFPQFNPNFSLTWRVREQLTLGLGFFTPTAVGTKRFGDERTFADGRTVLGFQDGMPAASRYILIDEQVIIGFPTIGFGVAAHPRFHLGLSFGAGFAFTDFTTMTRALPNPANDSFSDVYTRVDMVDRFLPRLTASVHAIPHDNLELSLSVIWTDTVRAKGDLSLDAAAQLETPVFSLTVPDSQLTAPMPWQVLLGVRYAHRTRERTRDPSLANDAEVVDAMSSEAFDVELDVAYFRNRHIDAYTTRLAPCVNNNACMGDRWSALGIVIPRENVLLRNWKDQLVIRLGSDINVLPGRLAVRFGAAYETAAFDDGYARLDFFSARRISGHVGGTVRFGRFDLQLAYAFLFQPSFDVTEDSSRIPQVSANGEGLPANVGRFSSHLHVASLGLRYHFR